MAGGKLQLTDDEMKTVLTTLQSDLKKKADAEVAAAGDANKKAGETFLAANKSKEGVTTLPDGLQYKILTPGNGAKPTATDTVVANYKGTLINGTEFDSSYKRGQPVTFPVGQVIKGWTEVLQMMPVGSKWEVYIPSDLAYGPQGPGRSDRPERNFDFLKSSSFRFSRRAQRPHRRVRHPRHRNNSFRQTNASR